MASIQWERVMVPIGFISIARESSFTTLMSPFSVFAIRWMVMVPISSAIFLQAVMISGFWSRDVYPGTHRLAPEMPSSIKKATCAGVLVRISVFFCVFLRLLISSTIRQLLSQLLPA